MVTTNASVTLDGGGLRFIARSGGGHEVVLDDATGDTGMRPAELIPIAVAGCTAMDVITILREKHQVVTSYEVRATAEQQEHQANAFIRIDIVHVVAGRAIDIEVVRGAIELAATNYCSGVGRTLSSGITEIHHAYVVRGDTGDEVAAEVIVTGPYDHVAPGLGSEPGPGWITLR